MHGVHFALALAQLVAITAESSAIAASQAANSAISLGGIISNCYSGTHGIDTITQDCGIAPNLRGYATVPNEWIEIYGSGLQKDAGQSLSALFRQYPDGSSAISLPVTEASGNLIYVSPNQVNVKVPTGLRSGYTFVSLSYTGAGAFETNADVVSLIGPRINGDGIRYADWDTPFDIQSGSFAAMWGTFADPSIGGVNTVYLSCDGAARQSVGLYYSSVNQINFAIPAGLATGARCAVTVNTGSIESQPMYLVVNGKNRYQSAISTYHWGTDFATSQGSGFSNLDSVTPVAANVGFKTIRVSMGASTNCGSGNVYYYSPSNCTPAPTLTSMAQRSDFVRLFQRPDITTFLITAYPLVTAGRPQPVWATASDQSTYQPSEVSELTALANHLGATYPSKKFVILNWEGDNSVVGYLSSLNGLSGWSRQNVKDLYLRYGNWLKSRGQAISAAAKGNVKSGAEYNVGWRAIMNQDFTVYGADCQSVTFKDSVLSTSLAANASFLSYLSFSSYDMINHPRWANMVWSTNPACGAPVIGQSYSLGTQEPSYDIARNIVQISQFVRLKYGDNKFMLGEAGFPDNVFSDWSFEGLNGFAGITRAQMRVINEAVAVGAAYSVNWQLFDNGAAFGGSGYGLYDSAGNVKGGGSAPKDLFYHALH